MNAKELLFIIKARNAARGVINQFRGQLKQTAASAKVAQKNLTGVSAAAQGVATSARRAAVSLSQLGKTKGLAGLNARVTQLKSGMAGLAAQTLKTAGVFAAGFVGFAALRGAVTTIIDFGEEMAKVQAISGATGEEFIKLEAAARDLGKTTRFTATEAAQGLVFLSRAGFTAAESVEAIGPALNLAQAGSLELGRSADILSNIMSTFSIEAGRATAVTDVLATVANSSNTSVEQLGDAMKFVGPVARAVGFDINEVSAAIGALGDSGLQGTLAGTGLRISIQKLLNPTRQARQALKELGIDLADVDPTANSLIDILGRLREAQEDVGDAEFARRVAQIFSARGSTAVLALTNQIDKVRELNDATRDAAGTAARTAKIMDANLGGALKALVSASEDLAIGIGKAGVGAAIEGLVRGFTDVIRLLGSVIDFFKQTNDEADGTVELFNAIAKGAVVFGATLLGGPVAGLIALAGILGGEFKDSLVTVGGNVIKFGELVRIVFIKIKAFVAAAFLPFVGFGAAAVQALQGNFRAASLGVSATLQAMRDNAQTAFEGLGDTIRKNTEGLDDIFGDGGKDSSTDFANKAKKGAREVKLLAEEVTELQDTFDALAGSFAPQIAQQAAFAKQEAEIKDLLSLSNAELKQIGRTRAELLTIQEGFNAVREREINFIREGNKALEEEGRLIGITGVARTIAAANAADAAEALRRRPGGGGALNDAEAAQQAARNTTIRENAQKALLAAQLKTVQQQNIEIALIGKTKEEADRMKIAFDALGKAREGGLSPEAAREFANAAVQSFDRVAEAQRDFQENGANGIREAFRKYSDEARNFAATFEKVTTDAIKGVEDELFNFVKTGKFNLKDLLTTFADDLLRANIKGALGQITGGLGLGGPEAQTSEGIVGQAAGLFGGGGGAASAVQTEGLNVANALRDAATQIRLAGGGAEGGGIGEALGVVFDDGQDEIGATLRNFNTGLAQTTAESTTSFGSILSGFGSSISGVFNSLLSSLSNLGGGGGGLGGGGGFGSFFGSIFSAAAAAKGGVIGSGGVMRLSKFQDGGIANSPQAAIFGEGDKPEAFVPLPDGRRIPVTMSGTPASRTTTVNNNITVQTQDAQSFGRNQNQIARKLGIATNRAMARDD